MSKVYVVQEPPPGVNIIAAKEYGELVFLYPLISNVFYKEKEIVDSFRAKLLMFNDNDFLLPIGDPALIGVATNIAACANEGRVRFLKWDRQEKMYYTWKVNMGRRW